MPEPSLTLSTLLLFALVFGMKHGFDADHLATIDGLARLQIRQEHPTLARLCGTLFSTGHGLVVLAAAGLLQCYGTTGLPTWLDPLGALISIVFLLSIGIVNLRCAWRPAQYHLGLVWSAPVSWLLRRPWAKGWIGSIVVGALFALSFDAMAVAAWFGLAGQRHGGMAATLLLGVSFVVGMVLTDTINGLLMVRLLRRSASFAQQAGRLFSVVLACSALLVATFEIAKLVSEEIEHWSDGKELVLGLAVLVTLLLVYLIARTMNNAAQMRQRSNPSSGQ